MRERVHPQRRLTISPKCAGAQCHALPCGGNCSIGVPRLDKRSRFPVTEIGYHTMQSATSLAALRNSRQSHTSSLTT